MEKDTAKSKGLELSYSIIEDLALGKEVPSRFKDKVYDSLYSAICEFLNSHPRFFDGLARDRVDGSSTHEAFKQVAHELFDVDLRKDDCERRLVWGRIIALFAFAVRLALENRNEPKVVEEVTTLLGSYIAEHAIPYIKLFGGWDTLIEDYPPPENLDAEMRRKLMSWWGICAGAAAIMYFTCGRH